MAAFDPKRTFPVNVFHVKYEQKKKTTPQTEALK